MDVRRLPAAALAGLVLAAPVPAFADGASPAHLSGAAATYRVSVHDIERPDGTIGETYAASLEVGAHTYRVSDRRLARLAPNSRLSIDGTVRGDRVALTALRPLAAPAEHPAAAAAGTHVSKVLVILASWTGPDAMTQSAAQAAVADDDAWFREVSYGREGMTAVSSPWVSIARPASCNSSAISDAAQAAAKAVGATYDSAAYDRTIVYVPKDNGVCTIGGESQIGADWTVIFGTLSTSLTTHEQGHMLGLFHSASYRCSPDVMANFCDLSEYGDRYDTMGGGGPVHYNALQKDRLGWLGSREVSLTDGGSATLAPFEQQADATQVAKVTVSDSRSYYVEYRQPLGVDHYLDWNGSKGMDGLLFHVADSIDTGTGFPYSLALDMSPDNDFYDPTLKPGQTWTSPEGWTFTVGALSSTGAGLTVTAPQRVPGTPAAPTATPGNGSATVSWAAPGSTGGSPILDYTVTSYPDFRSVTVSGTSATVSGLTNGTGYQFYVTARNSVGSSRQSDLSSTVTPTGPASAPGAPGTPTATAGNGSATVSWTAPGSTGGSPITGYTVTASPGGATATTTGTTATVLGLTNGTAYTFTVRATNAAGTGPASASSAAVTPLATTTTQDSSLQLGGWKAVSDPAALGGSYRSSSTTGDSASLPFSGTSVTLLARGGPGSGQAAVTIDGKSRGTVDLYRTASTGLSFPYTGLAGGAHTVVVRPLGTKSPAATGAQVGLDAFKVGATTVQDSTAKIVYSGWKGTSNASASGGGYRSSATAGATATWSFTGTAVDWVTATGPAYGKAEVLIDGVSRGTFDLYATKLKLGTLRSFTGLAGGPHTIVVRLLGTKNPAAKGATVLVDAMVTTA